MQRETNLNRRGFVLTGLAAISLFSTGTLAGGDKPSATKSRIVSTGRSSETVGREKAHHDGLHHECLREVHSSGRDVP